MSTTKDGLVFVFFMLFLLMVEVLELLVLFCCCLLLVCLFVFGTARKQCETPVPPTDIIYLRGFLEQNVSFTFQSAVFTKPETVSLPSLCLQDEGDCSSTESAGFK